MSRLVPKNCAPACNQVVANEEKRENVSNSWICPNPSKEGEGGKGKCDTGGLPYAGLSTDQVRAV
jgi:hypothetical protein